MLLPLTLLIALQEPKTFEEIELAKIKAYHELSGFREVMTITLRSEETAVFKRTIELDGPKHRAIFIMPGDAKLENVCDGATSRMIMHANKVYTDKKVDPWSSFDAKALLTKPEEDSLKFEFDTAEKPVLFGCSPPLVLKSFETLQEGGAKLRKVVASSTSKKGRTVTVTQWFLPDRWLIKQFRISGTGENGPIDVEGKSDKLEFNVTFPPDEFALDPAIVKDFQKVGN